MEKYLKCVQAPYGKRYTIGINIKGDYLAECKSGTFRKSYSYN